MFAVIADADNNSLVVDRLAVSPLRILRSAFRAVGHKKEPALVFQYWYHLHACIKNRATVDPVDEQVPRTAGPARILPPLKLDAIHTIADLHFNQ
jgi:hypothetical protein